MKIKLNFKKPSDRQVGLRAWHRMSSTPDGGADNACLAMQWMAYCDRTRRPYYLP